LVEGAMMLDTCSLKIDVDAALAARRRDHVE
jgi:hypothetical protein